MNDTREERRGKQTRLDRDADCLHRYAMENELRTVRQHLAESKERNLRTVGDQLHRRLEDAEPDIAMAYVEKSERMASEL